MALDPFSLLENPPLGGGDDSPEEFGEAVGEIPRETLLAFMAVLFFVHVGLFAASVGLLLVWFRGQWAIGGVVAVAGFLALWFAVAVYRWHERTERERR